MKLSAVSDQGIQRIFAELRRRAKERRPALERAGLLIAREAARKAPRGIGGPGQKRGTLAKSLFHRVDGEDTVTLASSVAYARVVEFGGDIRAPAGPNANRSWTIVGAKALVIPLSDAARALLGSLGAGQSLRSVPGLFLVTTKSGHTFLCRDVSEEEKKKKGKDTRKTRDGRVVKKHLRIFGVEFLFKIVQRVRHPKQPYAPRMSDAEFRRKLAAVVTGHLKRRQA